MTVIVETGSKEQDANSYIDTDWADEYHLTYGNTGWTGDVTVKEQALVIACQSLDLLYGPKYASSRLDGVQSLLWPRYPFCDRNSNTRTTSIPVELKRAQAELALMFINGVDLFPEGNTAATVQSESSSVGSISTSTTYAKSGKTETATYEGFRKIDLLLYPILKGRVGSVYLSR